jgi:hypothetical protein
MADQSEFIATYGPLADDVSKQTGIDSSVVLGQIAQETGWGQHVLNNNVFGISPGNKVAAYSDIPTAAQAYVDLMKTKNYSNVTSQATPDAQAQAISRAHYGPDQAYGGRISTLANQVRQAGYGAPSNDDLMQKMESVAPSNGTPTTQVPNVTGGPSNDDLMQKMEAASPAYVAPTPVVGSVGTKQFGVEPPNRPSDNLNMGVTTPPLVQPPATTASDIGNSIVNAAKQGYANAPSFLTPEGQNFADQLPQGAVISRGVNGLIGVAGGAYRGAQETVKQALGGGQLGNDAAAAMDILPALHMGGPENGGPMNLKQGYNVLTGKTPAVEVPTAPVSAAPVAEGNMLDGSFVKEPFAPGFNPSGVRRAANGQFTASIKPGVSESSANPFTIPPKPAVETQSMPVAEPAPTPTSAPIQAPVSPISKVGQAAMQRISDGVVTAITRGVGYHLGDFGGYLAGEAIAPIINDIKNRYGAGMASKVAVWVAAGGPNKKTMDEGNMLSGIPTQAIRPSGANALEAR